MAKQSQPTKNLGKTGLTGIAAGALKGVGSSARNFFEIASDIGSAANLPGQAAEFLTKGKYQAPTFGKGGMFDSGSAKGQFTKKELKPNTPAQQVGFFAEQVGEFFIPSSFLSKGAGLALKASTAPDVIKIIAKAGLEGAGSGLVTGVQSRDTKTTAQNAGISAGLDLLGAGLSKIPGAKAAVSFLSEQIPANRLNKILRPRDAEFNFGRNPGLSVVQEPDVLGVIRGPVTRGQLLTSIGKSKERVGDMISKALQQATLEKGNIATLDLTPAVLKPLDEAMQKAVRSGEQALVDRLSTLRNSLTQEFKIVDGKLVPTAARNLTVDYKTAQELKTELGQNTRWTGQAFDNDINKVRVAIYRNINDMIDSAVPGVKKLNERYGGLLTAEKALERRNTQLQRLVSLGLRQTGVGTATGVASYLSGNSALESALYGVAGAGALGLGGSVAVQTRAAKALSKLAPKEREAIFGLVPTLKNIYLQLRSTPDKSNDAANEDSSD